ncbi:amidase [Pseudonocardia sp. CA-142604]|uniref:amidase n=1 Tax=Pseudonocardia sp. CA-142604 TaxID=3240024 RepID=UPI003D90B7E1
MTSERVIVSFRELGMQLRSGALSPVEHVTDTLSRLAADTHNAVITLDAERAVEQARVLTEELARGEWRGPLHGVAVGVKDLFDVVGLPTRAGSNVLADAPAADADAPMVTRLREAGAVVVAKLHTHEFAIGSTGDAAATGPALNPHDHTRITGGSSSGSAAAIAAGHLTLALGTDTGASSRTPAALCGVVGLKPAFGTLPTERVFPLSETCDHVGVLAADTHAAGVAWDVLSKTHGTGGRVQAPDVAGVRVGVPVDDYWRPLDPVLTAAVDTALESLRARGASLVEVRTPMIDELAATYSVIVGTEAYATHAMWLADRLADYQGVTSERLLPWKEHPARGYVDALRTCRRLASAMRQAVGDVDVLVLPTTRLRATRIGMPEVDIAGTAVPVRAALSALTLPFNLTRWPAVSVPGDVTDGGLPAGVQVVGVGFDERGVLCVASALARRV